MVGIELANLPHSANHSQSMACWEQHGYKYNMTTTGLVCVRHRDGKHAGKRWRQMRTEQEAKRKAQEKGSEKEKKKGQAVPENQFHITNGSIRKPFRATS